MGKRAKTLLDEAGRVIKGIFEAQFPSSLSHIAAAVSGALIETPNIVLPGSELRKGEKAFEYFAVSNTLVLHFICPFLANPPPEWLKDKRYARRTLLMIAKILQALANGSTFDVDWMQPCNSFLIAQREAFESFCSHILVSLYHLMF